ncbi:MAG TPA: alpha/beta fold hydrolase [Micromonosporaceae bacterium]|nr:alpha/beta fold hydrolase [Micromonosporaceae bacterium]
MTYTLGSVPVAGGDLTVGAWGGTGPLVVAAHGITTSHQAWAAIGPQLGKDHRFVAADLRGRGGSRDLPEPYGMVAHAADLAAVVRAYGGGPAVLVGHSMGGFAVLETARRYPELVDRLVLVDGGVPLPPPPGMTADADPDRIAEAVSAAVGPAYARLSMTFPSREAYRQMWREHPSFAEWNAAVDAYVDYDLVGSEPELRPACRLEAALCDARDLYRHAGSTPVPVPAPAVFLRAERGMLDERTPFYAPGYATMWLPGVEESTVEDVNHYSILLGAAGAAAVVAAVQAAVRG